ncbi:helix-turn-helix domain-containing protein [Pantanalinema sp. GBBB05]|uniref:helix-turn-helix domain-containing protein n=1 Tax=Pantanalinema sp. GBBB05 TaxID=2604139 RepID=UPI001D486965|nr:helix-turn-helix transcriptional regulator [Pantanalinema sp. GBBB05]
MLLKPRPRRLQQPAIAQLVRELRAIMQLSQEKFADELGMTFATINRWENGHAMPSPLALKQINRLLNYLSQSSDARCGDGATLSAANMFWARNQTHEG